MCQAILHMLVLLTLSYQPSTKSDMKVTASVLEEKMFQGSRFELVALKLPFHSAQNWCEKNGGSLALISDEDTQLFLERHMNSEKDMWIGLAPSCSTNQQHFLNVEGPLSWLDGSPVTFSKWARSPPPGAACGYILSNSNFQWEATRDCNQKMHFICQFDSGRSIICAGHNTTLQCGSGQVLMIDGGFYGRRNIHYCRSRCSAPTFAHQECGWADVGDSVKDSLKWYFPAHCQGHQVCQITEVMNLFDDLCPELRSYLTVNYHCIEVLSLSVVSVAAVSEDVNITTFVLLPEENLHCKLNTGDGQSSFLHSSNGSGSVSVHRYTRPDAFVVALECTNSERHITAQRIITIQEPVTEIGVIRCYAGNVSFHETNCRALHGGAFQIQMEVKAGTNVVYRIKKKDQLLADLSVIQGNVPQNITVKSETAKQLKPGCHLLTLYASNMVTFPEVSTNLQICILEKITGLQATVLKERDDSSGSPCITLGVSFKRGEPVQIHFSLTGNNNVFSKTIKMHTRKEIFHIRHPLQGPVQVKIRAWNIFSSLEVVMFGSGKQNSVIKQNDEHSLSFNNKMRKQHVRVVRSTWDIEAVPSTSVNSINQTITLQTSNLTLLNSSTTYTWKCDSCACKDIPPNSVYTIQTKCLPEPFQFDKYQLTVEVAKQNKGTQSICVTVTPQLDTTNEVSLSCTDGCDPVNKKNDANFEMECDTNVCSNIVWYIEDIRSEDQWDNVANDCYKNAQRVPLIDQTNDKTTYTVKKQDISDAQNQNKDITVVLIYSKNSNLYYKTSIIKTSSSMNSSGPTTKSPKQTQDNPGKDNSTGGLTKPGKDNSTGGPTKPGKDNSTGGLTKPGKDNSTGGLTKPGKDNSTGGPTKPGKDNSTGGPTKPGKDNSTGGPTKPGKDNSTGGLTKPGKDNSTGGPTKPGKDNGTGGPTKPGKDNSTGGPTKPGKDNSTGGPTKPGKDNSTGGPTNTPSGSTTVASAGSPVRTTSATTTRKPADLMCTISPNNGTVFDAFKITCSTKSPCRNCMYCFTANGNRLLCKKDSVINAVYLPHGDSSSNYNLLITATAKYSQYTFSTTLTVQVMDFTSNSSSGMDLSSAVVNSVDQLIKQGLLSGETVGEIVNTVAQKLNDQPDASSKEDRQQVREQVLGTLIDTINEFPVSTPEETQVVAGGLTSLTEKGDELSVDAQVSASKLFANLSVSILHMSVSSAEDEDELITAASIIVEGVGNILQYSSHKNISDALLETLTNTQSALLNLKVTNEAPTIIVEPHISLYVRRVTPESLNSASLSVSNSSSPTFSLPELPSSLFPSGEPVDVRMLSLDKNPFSWNERGNISGLIGALSLTTIDGSDIPVENLSEDIEILLPRPGGQVNTSVLDLGNYSTTAINIPSADDTLLLKMVPSKDPLPFKLFLGYMNYPTDTNYVAMTEMPQSGTTQEERYTWILNPTNLKGRTGIYYLVVRPIVGPGIKSINATLSITPITSSCRFWNETQLDWSNNGCKVGVKSTPLLTQCLCNHLTFFGSSFFVTPNLVDPSQTAELFSTFAQNPVVVCFVGALFLTYLLVVVWARRKDIQDVIKVKGTELEDNDPMDNYRYLLCVCTGHRMGASTSSQVVVTLLGEQGNSKPHHLTDPKKPVFERGAVDVFLLTTPYSLGELEAIRLWHNNSGSHPAWFVGNILVQDLQTKQKFYFLCNSWLAINFGDCCLDKRFPVSTEMDLKKFSNLFFMKTVKDFNDGHLWYSVINRPPSSTFTCVQRVSCCFSLLLCTMLTSIMFYGIPTDPSDQVMELGHFEFTWQQFMIGVQSSLIMFPINILIVSIFRNTRPREVPCCQKKTKKSKSRQHDSTLQTVSSQTTTKMNGNVNLDIIIKDITRILQSLSETTKSNIPFTESEFGPGKGMDINGILSEVEDFLKQNYKNSNEIHLKAQSQLPGEGIQKKSNKTQYLFRQMCHLEKELNLLEPSCFPNPGSFRQALQHVQAMKSFLGNHLSIISHVTQHEQDKSRPADTMSGDNGQKKKVHKHGVLPWWFIFVGWLLVFATSFITGYFTMLYGLKFGKDRSISWLVSMIVSFFQSLLLIQPLKVICLAVFFALVIKKADEEDFQDVTFEKVERRPGDQNSQTMSRWAACLYEPPPPADIEKMKRNKIMEQKAFALLTEILIYLGFMWMLLMVAYGQKNPNAFFLNQHITNSFTGNIPGTMSPQDVYTWANTSLLQNLFGQYPGFITDGNSKLVGDARLRQLRVKKDSCQVAGIMLGIESECDAPYSWEAEDMGSYKPGWNHSVRENVSARTSSPWEYQTQAELRTPPFWGNLELYRGGGFVVFLGPDIVNASCTLEDLFISKWLDVYTRAIFVEFTVYNANVNLFCIVTFLMETSAVGAFQFYSELHSVQLYPSTGGLYFFIMASEIIYLLFIIYYMFRQGKLMKQQRLNYFNNKWNLLELSIILLSWSAVAIFIKRTLIGNRDMTYYQHNRDQFVSFYETATAESTLQYLIAFLVLLSTIKLWHLLRLNPKMNLITAALQRAWSDISNYLVIIVIMLVAYSTASNLIYGWGLYDYKTFTDSLLTVISLQIGLFNYDEVLSSEPLLGGLLFGSCIVFMTFMVLNLLVSVILVALNQEQIHHKPSEEQEVVDLLLNKICNLFGVRYKSEKDSMRLDVRARRCLALKK